MPEGGNSFDFNELSSEQRRQLVDARQLYEAYRQAKRTWKHSYTGSMRWVTRKGRDYLHWKRGRRERSLGRRSPETEATYEAFVSGRQELKTRLAQLSQRLDRMAPVNRALDLGRLPTVAARILRRMDEGELLGTHLLVVGTNALFAYESSAGVVLGADLLATGDADLLWDSRQGIKLLAPEIRREGILGIIQKVDRSFQLRGAGDFRAINADGYYIDVIRPEETRLSQPRPRPTIGERGDDLRPSPIHGLHWLVNAPRFEAIVIGADGYPVRLATVDPRAFALHKLWISQLPRRDPVKKTRDRIQAQAVAELCRRYLSLSFDEAQLRALPHMLRVLAAELAAPSADDEGAPEPNW
jgi:hypothetical protein